MGSYSHKGHIETNADQLKKRWGRRREGFRNFKKLPREFAFILHDLRKANLEKMVYARTPWGKSEGYYSVGPTGDLKRDENWRPISTGEYSYEVSNSSDHYARRVKMTGDYSRTPGLSREADWPLASIIELQSIHPKIYEAIRGKIWISSGRGE